jgi:carboxymethylenebutenolidase
MPESFLSGGKTIRLDAYTPPATFQPAHASRTPGPAIVFLHGSGGNIGLWLGRFAPFLTAVGVSLFAPHYFDRTATTRADLTSITDGIHVPQWLSTVDDALHHIAAQPTVDPSRIALLGVSLGGFLALGLAATCSASPNPPERHRIRAVVELAGGLVEPYRTQATSAFPPTLILHGETDTVVPLSHASDLDRRLAELNVPHQLLTFPGEDHWFSKPSTQAQLPLVVAAFLSKYLQ